MPRALSIAVARYLTMEGDAWLSIVVCSRHISGMPAPREEIYRSCKSHEKEAGANRNKDNDDLERKHSGVVPSCFDLEN